MPTDLTTIKSWSREQLESAFSQREFQLKRLEKQCAMLRSALDKNNPQKLLTPWREESIP